MRLWIVVVLIAATAFACARSQGQSRRLTNQTPTGNAPKKTISFKLDVLPIVRKNCLPCHAEDNFNPSELSLDSYELLMEGGTHGPPVVPGDSKESLIIRKTGLNPPFGDRMPLNSKQKIEAGTAKWLTNAELKIIAEWVEQGAKNN